MSLTSPDQALDKTLKKIPEQSCKHISKLLIVEDLTGPSLSALKRERKEEDPDYGVLSPLWARLEKLFRDIKHVRFHLDMKDGQPRLDDLLYEDIAQVAELPKLRTVELELATGPRRWWVHPDDEEEDSDSGDLGEYLRTWIEEAGKELGKKLKASSTEVGCCAARKHLFDY